MSNNKNNNTIKTIGELIKAKRLAMNLNQLELAKILCVDESTISRWERNMNLPDSNSLSIIVKGMGISSKYFKMIFKDPLNLSIPISEILKDKHLVDNKKWNKYYFISAMLVILFIRGYFNKGINGLMDKLIIRVIVITGTFLVFVIFSVILLTDKLKKGLLRFILEKMNLLRNTYEKDMFEDIFKLFNYFLLFIVMLLVFMLFFLI